MDTELNLPSADGFRIRPGIREDDIEVVVRMCRRVGNFTEEEVLIAREVAEDAFVKGAAITGYNFFFCETAEGTPAGYTCVAPIPLTDRRYEVYWIVVDPGYQRKGLGTLLMQTCEAFSRHHDGELLYLDTSAKESYDATRAFYEVNGFAVEALLRDFYRPGDDKVIYKKVL